MLNCLDTRAGVQRPIIPIIPITEEGFSHWYTQQKARYQTQVHTHQFKAKPMSFCLLLDERGQLEKVVLGVETDSSIWGYGKLSTALPEGAYSIESDLDEHALLLRALAWGLGAYRFERYKKYPLSQATLILPKSIDLKAIESIISSLYWVRDLINTPAADMGPTQLAEAAIAMARQEKAKCKLIVGEKLIKSGYEAIYTVGKGSCEAPRLLDLRWGSKKNPKVTLVGKGVCFDSGGLNLKTTRGMALMKKDMAGAAHVLGLARMIMQAKLPVCLRVLTPLVENAISGSAYHPGDVVTLRNGKTVEITNTDAEGRMVLADALCAAVEEEPELLIDVATLTAAARIALGDRVHPLFTQNDELARALLERARYEKEPLWRMPLFTPYRSELDSKIADIANASTSGYGGAITAALFLRECVPDSIPWAHFDIMAWNRKTLPGRPEGGEANVLRTLFSYLKHRYGR